MKHQLGQRPSKSMEAAILEHLKRLGLRDVVKVHHYTDFYDGRLQLELELCDSTGFPYFKRLILE